jgi:hypothetical protein
MDREDVKQNYRVPSRPTSAEDLRTLARKLGIAHPLKIVSSFQKVSKSFINLMPEYIVYLCEDERKGGAAGVNHWVVFHNPTREDDDDRKVHVNFFDSYGMNPFTNPFYNLSDDVEWNVFIDEVNRYQLQDTSTGTCGIWCIAFIYFDGDVEKMISTLGLHKVRQDQNAYSESDAGKFNSNEKKVLMFLQKQVDAYRGRNREHDLINLTTDPFGSELKGDVDYKKANGTDVENSLVQEEG